MARLKNDIAGVDEEISCQKSGVKTLENFDDKQRTGNNGCDKIVSDTNLMEFQNNEQYVENEEIQPQKHIQDLIASKKKFSTHTESEESKSKKVGVMQV